MADPQTTPSPAPPSPGAGFRPPGAELTRAELAAVVRALNPGQVYLGDPPERWIRAVLLRSIRVKTAELAAPVTPQRIAGARRILVSARRNHTWAMGADVPSWIRAAAASHVAAAEQHLRDLGAQP